MAPTLQTPRLTVRGWRIEDAPAALEIYGSPDVARWLIGLQDGMLLDRASLMTMWTPGRYADGKPTQWGMGWPLRPDLRHPVADVAVDLVEIEVALENPGAALHVMPQRFPAFAVRRVGSDQARDDGAADFAAMHVRPVQEVEIVIGIDMGAGLQADHGAKGFRCSSARCSAMRPPIEQPMTTGCSRRSASQNATIISV